MRARDEQVHRLHDKEENGTRDEHERDNRVDKMSVHKLTAVDGKEEPAEVRYFCYSGNERR